MRSLRLLFLFFPLAPGLGAEDPTTTLPASRKIAASARAALEELTSLEATARADREAFRQNEADLERAIADYQKPLPERPTPLGEFSDYRPERRFERKRPGRKPTARAGRIDGPDTAGLPIC